MTCNNVWCCHNNRRFGLPTALVNVNMVANGKINSRLSPTGRSRSLEIHDASEELWNNGYLSTFAFLRDACQHLCRSNVAFVMLKRFQVWQRRHPFAGMSFRGGGPPGCLRGQFPSPPMHSNVSRLTTGIRPPWGWEPRMTSRPNSVSMESWC